MVKHKKFLSKRIISVFTAVAAVLTIGLAAYSVGDYNVKAYSTEMRGLSASQITADMGAGWNLGNSLESSDNETNWGNPRTTKAMIDAIAAKGFRTLRVPVRWDDHYTDWSNYTIDSSYMDRVEEVVNYGLSNGMYVILNVHHNDLQT